MSSDRASAEKPEAAGAFTWEWGSNAIVFDGRWVTVYREGRYMGSYEPPLPAASGNDPERSVE